MFSYLDPLTVRLEKILLALNAIKFFIWLRVNPIRSTFLEAVQFTGKGSQCSPRGAPSSLWPQHRMGFSRFLTLKVLLFTFNIYTLTLSLFFTLRFKHSPRFGETHLLVGYLLLSIHKRGRNFAIEKIKAASAYSIMWLIQASIVEVSRRWAWTYKKCLNYCRTGEMSCTWTRLIECT